MSLTQVFTDTLDKLTSIKVKTNVVSNPARSNNSAKTISNVNDVFKYINIWDNQIDELIKGNTYAFKTDSAIFIEFIPGESKMLLNKVTSYPESAIIFHIFSILLNSPNDGMERNTEIYRFRDIAKSNLLGWSPYCCSSFMNNLDTLDYKHGNISKYLLGFNFNFTDFSGSIFDPNSPNYLIFGKLKNPTLGSINIFQNWVSGVSYGALSSVVVNTGQVYLCKTDNSDLVFTSSNWYLINQWYSGNKYKINSFVYIYNHVYECIIENNDSIFNPDNWEFIV